MAEDNAQEATPSTTGTAEQTQPTFEGALFDDLAPQEGPGAFRPDAPAIVKALQVEKPAEKAPDPAPEPKTPSAAPQAAKSGPGVKPIKLKYEDQELEYAPDKLVIPTPVNGKEEAPTLQELRDNYAGKTNWSKRFEYVNRREKALAPRERHVRAVEAKMEQFAALVKADNYKGLVDAVVTQTGGDPQIFWESLRAEIVPEDYSDEQREALRAKREASTLKKQATDALAENERLVQAARAEREIQTLMTQYSLSRSDLEAGWAEVVEAAQAGSLPQEDLAKLRKADNLTKARYTIERMVLTRRVQRVVDLADQIDPAIKENEEALKHLFALEATGASEDSLQRVARLYATPSGPGESAAPNGTAAKPPVQPPASETPPVERAQLKKSDPDAVLFDDL